MWVVRADGESYTVGMMSHDVPPGRRASMKASAPSSRSTSRILAGPVFNWNVTQGEAGLQLPPQPLRSGALRLTATCLALLSYAGPENFSGH